MLLLFFLRTATRDGERYGCLLGKDRYWWSIVVFLVTRTPIPAKCGSTPHPSAINQNKPNMKLSQLHPNEGQIAGVPANPRQIRHLDKCPLKQ